MGAARRTAHRLALRALPSVPAGVREVALALAARMGSGPAVLPGLPPGPVLALAPHPDDETIGCGGALARHAAAGDAVTVVVATSGGATRGGARDVAMRRESECRAACAALGVPEPVFLRLRDGGLDRDRGALTAALRRLGDGARTVYVPALVDPHPDHRAAGLALAEAGLPADVFGYEVWSPAPADVVLDVTAMWPRKERALRSYAIALESVDYLAATTGLATYRAVMAALGPSARAEGYTRLSAVEHADLARASSSCQI